MLGIGTAAAGPSDLFRLRPPIQTRLDKRFALVLGMNTPQGDRIQKEIRALRASLVTVISRVDELSDLIERMSPTAASPPTVVAGGAPLLVLDRSNHTVRWKERTCFLRNTMAFRLLERLARRPNEYVSTERLLDELWEAMRTHSTVRSTVCGLKAKLRASGMRDLAERIDGKNPGHYGLMLERH